MPLAHSGLVKLAEECGELVQAAMKKIGFDGEGDIHWDGSNLNLKLEEEIADVLAACAAVGILHFLDTETIRKRMMHKLELFFYWQLGGTESKLPDDYEPKFAEEIDPFNLYDH